jgi:Glycogen debranching enzyme N terminal
MAEKVFEWLEADGLGGFASHTSHHTRTRRYHALLLMAKKPPGERRVLVNGVDVVIDLPSERVALTSQTYKPANEGEPAIVRHEGRPLPGVFDGSVWPTWRYDLGEAGMIEHSIMVPHGSTLVVLSWRLTPAATGPVRLSVRPFLSGRDYHSLHRENADFDFAPRVDA